jgi:hypothetical protein
MALLERIITEGTGIGILVLDWIQPSRYPAGPLSYQKPSPWGMEAGVISSWEEH